MAENAQRVHRESFLDRAWRRSRAAGIAVVVIVVLLVAGRVAMPYILKTEINRELSRLSDYSGGVESVGVHLWRGAYSLENLRIMQRSGQVQRPFVAIRDIDFSLAWRELIHGRIVSDIVLDHPELNFVKGPTVASSQLSASRQWQDIVKDIFPIDITSLKITSGLVRFQDDTSQPKVDISLQNLDVLATGLRNRATPEAGEFPAKIDLAADTLGDGKIRTSMSLEPLALKPHFLVRMQLEGVSMPALNEFLKAYAGIDVSDGVFAAFTEVSARDGHFTGYFKPFFQRVNFKALPGEKRSIGEDVRVLGARIFAFIFKNSRHDQVATRIPFSGEFANWNFGIWPTIVTLVHNGFIQALPQKLDSSADSRPVAPAKPSAEPRH